MEKGKISALQIGMMIYPTIVATVILTVPSITATFAKNDLWISPILASFIGFLEVYLAFRLHRLYPKQSIIQYSQRIVGWIPGKLIGFLILLFYLQINGLVLRQYAEFIVGVFLPHTPISIIMTLMVLISVYAARGGVEIIGRAAQLFFPLLVIPLIFIILMLIPDVDVKNILPIMEHGIMPAVRGATLPIAWFSLFFLISFLLPYLSDEKKAVKWINITVCAVMLTMVMTDLITLFLYGGNTSKFVYPFMNAARYISKADFFENLESVILVMWVLGIFVKLSVHLYVTSLGFAQWMNLTNYRPIVLPVGYFAVIFGFWDLPNFARMARYIGRSAPFFIPSIHIVIPCLLLMIALIRNRKKRLKGDPSG